MFCPQCGQQQASDGTRFCSRCGFQMEAVASLLATGGATPAGVMQSGAASVSPRRKGARLGGKLMLLGLFLGPMLAMLHEAIRLPAEFSILGAIIFFAGLMRLVYALIFEDGTFRRPKTQPPSYVPPAPAQFAPPRPVASLSPSPGVPARSYVTPSAETGEIVYRPSVTEGTTRLLVDERDETAR
jgi:hypothetical protein